MIRLPETQTSSPAEKTSENKDPEKEDNNEAKEREGSSQRRASSRSRSDKTAAVAKRNEKEIVGEDQQPRKERESNRHSARSKTKQSEAYISYPFVSEEDEIDCYESSKKDVEIYARSLGRLLFKNNIKALYKDQDEDRRQWLTEILNFRFPTRTVFETKSKMSYVISAINKNALAAK
ncbi:hypothetical protein KIN20_012949 [Parelaphostrongylus tenuis]|uniref:Uncharacterized protein n=1 Tax=Parelaphostrongylus tenuis TaxID=148309 RepID=A0AAD5QQR7_PARTN|nr:hypothetical protein KIN20_012949 [Parelaphostrongylus tenuis]